MTRGLSELPRGAVWALTGLVAAVLVWRALAVGIDAINARNAAVAAQATAMSGATRAPVATVATGPAGASGSGSSDAAWRQRLARNPSDVTALLALALDLERQGKGADASAAMQDVLRLAPGDPATLLNVAAYFQRVGDQAKALLTLRQVLDASQGDSNSNVLQVLLSALDTGRHHEYFEGIARDNPSWWPAFFRAACTGAKNGGAVEALFATRVKASVATADERSCVIGRLQREGQWTSAYLLWLNGLPLEQRQRVGYVFNGGFELPLTDTGFDWRVPAQEDVRVSIESTDGTASQRVLEVAFANKRYGAPPVHQYLVLAPGRYRFEGRGRTDLETLLGLQWGLYCHDPRAREARQLAQSDRFVGSADWRGFQQDFVVPGDCPVQLLQLDLAKPKGAANASSAVAVKLKGRVWFDDLRVVVLD